MRIPFSLRGIDGSIDVEVRIDENPSEWGVDLLLPGEDVSVAGGYPVCTATVTYPVQGYGAAMGWVQLVRSTDGPTGPDVFAPDPIAMYADVNTPYAWFGFSPTLFDGPFRGDRADLEWLAYSFLCFSSTALMTQEVSAITGFSWGFQVRDGEIRIVEPEVLEEAAWNEIVPTLGDRYRRWGFVVDFQDH